MREAINDKIFDKIIFISNEHAIEYYFKHFGFPKFQSVNEFSDFVEREIPMVVLKRKKVCYTINRLRALTPSNP